MVCDGVVCEMGAGPDVVVEVVCFPRAKDLHCAVHGDEAAIGYFVRVLCVGGRVTGAEDLLADSGFDSIAADDCCIGSC